MKHINIQSMFKNYIKYINIFKKYMKDGRFS